MHKTGTVSLCKGLEELGYRSIHGTKKNSDLIIRAIFENKDPLYYLHQRYRKSKKLSRDEEFDAFADLYAIIDHFVMFDRLYPNARFILTTRDDDKWVRSVENQLALRRDTPYFHYWYFQNELQWLARKQMHENTVKQYFAGRPDKLLVMDITRGEGFDKLCPFLGLDVLDKPFPHENSSSELSTQQDRASATAKPG